MGKKHFDKDGNEIIPQVKLQTTTYQGPIPPPHIMEGYKELDASFPERIIVEFEKNAQHIRDQEKLSLAAVIKSDQRGQIIGGILVFILLAIVFASLWFGNYEFAGVGGLAFIALMIKSFIIVKKPEKYY